MQQFRSAYIAVCLAGVLSGCTATNPKETQPQETPSPQVTDSRDAPKTRRPEASSSCTASENPTIPTKTTLVLKSISPQSGSSVDSSAVVEAEFEYAIKNYVPDGYEFIPQFETVQGDSTFDGSFPNSRYAQACGPAGILRMTVPLIHVWNEPRTRHPLSMFFILLEKHEGFGMGVATSEHIEYKTGIKSPDPAEK